ncbi:MAG TPA: hypothetical protein VLE22_03950 [Bryobacteraceae bacterium]|nr:hypothetical protein [Bryobacteraceae bacterium]
MQYLCGSARLTRRAVLTFTAAASASLWNRLFAANSDFWNRKKPEDWSSDEIERLVTKSPWAKEVTAEFNQPERGGRGGGMGVPGGGMGGPTTRRGGMGMPPIGGGGMGIPPLGGGGRDGRPSGGMERRKVTVRWESAKPIREALKTPLPDSLADRYVISVNGLPMMPGSGRRREDEGSEDTSRAPRNMLERLKETTFLQPKGKESVQPGVVERQPSAGGASLLFGFSRETLVLHPEDKEVTFTMAMGPLEVKTKFKLTDMTYREELAL